VLGEGNFFDGVLGEGVAGCEEYLEGWLVSHRFSLSLSLRCVRC
jgi:hypothetical protein